MVAAGCLVAAARVGDHSPVSVTLHALAGVVPIDAARDSGTYLTSRLREMQDRHPLMGDVRCPGLFTAVELVKDRETKEPATKEAEEVYDRGLKHGVMFGTSRYAGLGNVVKIKPPLSIKRDEMDRVIDVFPAGQQGQIRTQLAGTLEGVIAQTLVPTADGQGRVAAVEVLAPDDAVRNLIRQAKIEQVYSIMQTGGKKGMSTMEQALAELVLRGIITQEIAMGRSSRPEMLLGLLGRAAGESGASAPLRIAQA